MEAARYARSTVYRYSCIEGFHLVGASERVCSEAEPISEEEDDDDFVTPTCAVDAARSLRVKLSASEGGLRGDIRHAVDDNEQSEHKGMYVLCTYV